MNRYEFERLIAGAHDRYNQGLANADSELPRGRGFVFGPEERARQKAEAKKQFDLELTEASRHLDELYEAKRLAVQRRDDHLEKLARPLLHASPEEQHRAEALRPQVRREIEHSSPAEMTRLAGVVARSGEWINAQVWRQELAERINQLPQGAREDLVQALPLLEQAGRNPQLDAETAKAEQALTRADEDLRAATELLRPTQVAAKQAQMAATRAYSRF
jgi:aminoglycoside/choline kinase family phosphotransferase